MDQRKTRELVLYIAQTCKVDPDFGMVKLNKVLFSADFTSYARRGVSITGEDYQKGEQGPIVRLLKPLLKAAELAGDLVVEDVGRGPYIQQRVIPLRSPNLSLLTEEEIRLVNESLEFLKGKTASELSEYFHQFLGWQAADVGEVIPYQTVYFFKRMPTKDEADYALTLTSEKVL